MATVRVTVVRLHTALASAKPIAPELFYAGTVDPTAAELQDIADAANTEWTDTATRALFETSYLLGKVGAQLMETEEPSEPYPYGRLVPVSIEYVAAGDAVGGSATSNSAAPGSSVVVKRKTATPGRSYRGRVYLPPCLESSVDSTGFISTVAQSAFVDVVERIDAAVLLAVALTVPVVTSRKLGVNTPVTVTVADQYLKSQRRRNLRG